MMMLILPDLSKSISSRMSAPIPVRGVARTARFGTGWYGTENDLGACLPAGSLPGVSHTKQQQAGLLCWSQTGVMTMEHWVLGLYHAE